MTQPVFVVVCGINGAGKSTLADALAATLELDGLPFLNPDRLSAGYRQGESGLTRDLADMRALRHVAGETHRLMAGRQSFVSETVGANASYRRYVQAAQAAGYLVRVVFVALRTAEQSIARVALRVRMGGHSIPTADILRRWPAVHANLGWFAAHADMLDVYANADDSVAPRVIARVRAGQIEQLDPAAVPEVTHALKAVPQVAGAGGQGSEADAQAEGYDPASIQVLLEGLSPPRRPWQLMLTGAGEVSRELAAGLDRILELFPSVGGLTVETADGGIVATRDFKRTSADDVDTILAGIFRDHPHVAAVRFAESEAQPARTATRDDPHRSPQGKASAAIRAAVECGEITPEEALKRFTELWRQP